MARSLISMKFDLNLHSPFLNAAGTLGFAPDPHGPLDLSRLGAFVTNPVSQQPRTPARGPRYLPCAGGFLLHTGHPNPGLNAVIHRHARRWSRLRLPVIVHLLAQELEEMGGMVRRLEGLPGVTGIELGLPSGIDSRAACALAKAASGELPLVVRLPMEQAAELAPALAGVAEQAGIAAVSLAPPRGRLPVADGELVSGRLYGPAVFPIALATLAATARAGVPVIGGGGVYSLQQAEAMLAAGAVAVQLDSILWKGGL
jgi:dihydroorotate dehydrogenase (NAD+) catalytic subunit